MTTDELVEEIFGRCRERLDRGEAVDIDAIVQAHPDLASKLRARFAAVRLVDRVGARDRTRRNEAAASTRVGKSLGPYRIESLLGAGGMGTVYLASVEGGAAAAAEARVALKVFHPHLVARERFAARFEREAELGRRVDHPNVVRTLGAGGTVEEDRTIRWLVMEHVEGRTLRALLAEMGRLPEELCRHVGREVARGLSAIHAVGAVHRDVKPENVIVTSDHAVKVMDLGVAHLEDATTLSETGDFVGSLRYAAPEQLAAPAPRSATSGASSAKGVGAVDGRADLHALGLLLHELATGEHPFPGEEFGDVVRQVLDVRPRRCGELVPQVSPFFEELVAQLLEKDRERRPVSAEAVAAILAEGEASDWWHRRAAEIRRETRRPLRRIRIPRETALYGRNTEIALLRSLYEKAKTGDGQVVLVEGEAGIGKSRLVDEFVGAIAASGEDVDFLFGSYPPGGAATASGAFTTAYRAHLGDDEDALREALAPTPLLVPAFAALLRGDAPPEGADRLTKDSLQTVFVHATRSFAAKRTTIVLIDDLHFAPEEGRALFAALALALPGHRILLLGGARRSVDEKWSASLARLAHTTRLPLPRLGARDLVELLVDALKSRHLAEELAAKIATKSDGNPFFVFEILRGLREGRFLTRRPDGTWITTGAIREIDVPPSVVEVIQARVSDLDADDRNALEVASCAGFEFDATLVGAVLGVAPIPLLQRLGRIEKSHRLVRSVGHRFAFDHHQVQEVLYAGLSAPLREAYHAALADALEARSGAAAKEPKDLDGALCVELAEHFLAGAKGSACAGHGAERTGAVPDARTGAGLAGGEFGSATARRALRYLDVALTHLERGWLSDAAVRLTERALAVPGLVTGSARVAMLLRLVNRLDVLGRRGPEYAAIEEALALAREVGDRMNEVHARRGLGFVCLLLGRYAEAREHLEGCRVLAQELGDRLGEAHATGNLGLILQYQGRFPEAREHMERQLALSREVGDRQGEAQATGNLGNVFRSLGRFAEARERFERCLTLSSEIGDRRGEALATGCLGILYFSLGRFVEARENYERQLTLAREIGDRRGEAVAAGNLGAMLLTLGLLAEGREQYERQLALSREIGFRPGEANALGNLGTALVWLGRLADARQHYERQLSIAREIGDRNQENCALLCLAELAGETGDVPLAESLFADALDVQRAIGARTGEAETLRARGALLARTGRNDAARADLSAALALARELSLPSVELAALACLSTLPGGDVAAPLAVLAAHGERTDVRTQMEARLLLWRATHDRAHLDEAKRLLDEFVAHAPPECRPSMTTDVRLYREIEAAWREETGRVGASPAT